MSCEGCRNPIGTGYYLQCMGCHGKYDINCLNIKQKQYLALTEEYRTIWRCPGCNNVTRRTGSNLNTPVRLNQVPLAQESMNMSLDNLECSITPIKILANESASASGAAALTWDKFSDLLDQKLKSSLSTFMVTFRQAVQEDIKQLVRSEMNSAMQELKDEMTTTTDFLGAEQMSLRGQIEDKNKLIKSLESDNIRLQKEIGNINGRLNTIERMSRSHNLEIQAVPESRSENILMMFKKLCETVKVSIDDSNIHAYRRVAKHIAASNRPRNILITLSTPLLRDTILSAASRFNKNNPNDTLNSIHMGIAGETRRIFVTEHLSPECKSLHAATRKIAKEKGYKYVWVRYGRVYVRKDDSNNAIHIKSLDSLDKLD